MTLLCFHDPGIEYFINLKYDRDWDPERRNTMDRRSLYTPLKEEGLTTLIIRYDYKTGKEYLAASKEWDADIRWEDYGKTFFTESLLTQDDIRLNHVQTRQLFGKYGLTDYLEEVLDLLRAGKYFGLDCYYNAQKDWRFTANIHTYRLGHHNFEHCIYTGGIRRHEKDEPEIDVLIDGLNLARAESHKHVMAGLRYGGGKITVQAEQVNLEAKDELGFLAFALDKVRFFTGPDMRYPVELADVLTEYTPYINGGTVNNPIGASGDPTAWGTEAAMKEAAAFLWGDPSLEGRTVAVMGLGAVGFPQAGYLLRDGAKLIVADPDHSRIEALREAFPDAEINEVSPEEILTVKADILCPCAVGGFLDEEAIDRLNVAMVFGAANNQLAAKTIGEEIELSKRIADRGILYEECWVHNIGGVISGAVMHTDGMKADRAALMNRVKEICSSKTRENLKEAEKKGITPTQNAYEMAESLIYE